ncbi:MAG TPA: GNAT family N-acetyltransferase, partial [Bacillales bacterium]
LLADVPDGWPADELKSFLPFYIEDIEKDPDLLGWGIWVLMDRNQNIVVGDAGFKGKPDPSGIVEIGYSVHADFRNRGYASEAALALSDWAFTEHRNVRKILAECDEENISSIRVLKKLGMNRQASDGRLLQWELERKPEDS